MSAASPADPLLAGSFIRVSAAAADSTAPADQRRLCQQAAERNGEHIPPHFEFQEPAARKGRQRSGLDAALKLLHTRQIKTLYVGSRLDRLSRRDMREVGLVLDDLERVGGRIVFVADELDTSKPDVRPIIATLAEQAHAEHAARGPRMTAEEMRAWVAESRAKQGLPPTIRDPDTIAKVAAMVADALVASCSPAAQGAERTAQDLEADHQRDSHQAERVPDRQAPRKIERT